jgi:hypothetical protein
MTMLFGEEVDEDDDYDDDDYDYEDYNKSDVKTTSRLMATRIRKRAQSAPGEAFG